MEGSWTRGVGKVVRGKMLNQLNEVEVEGVDLPSKATFGAIILVMTNIRGE